MTDKKAHLHKNNDNLSIQNQVDNLLGLNLFLWRHFPVSSDRLLRIVGWLKTNQQSLTNQSISLQPNSIPGVSNLFNAVCQFLNFVSCAC